MIKLLNLTNKSIIAATLMIVLALAASAGFLSWGTANAQTGPVTVTILKYVDGELATATSADNATFQMTSSWDAENLGEGSGQYALSPTGATPYRAITSSMSSGADYSTHELMNDDTGASCSEGTQFALEGYTSGNTLAEAEAGNKSSAAISFTSLTQSKFVIVWNDDCTTPPPAPTGDVTVTIIKFIDGQMATEATANGTDFQMQSSWDAENIGTGSGSFALSTDNEVDFQAVTSDMSSGADYSTHEIMDNITGEDCDAGKPFALVGYSTGDTIAQAVAATMSTTAPSFTNLTDDKFIIVWNDDCDTPNTGGQIGGEVTDGEGVLAVTSVDVIDSTASADGTFENGWEYVFNITVPTDETDLSMKFSDWLRTSGGGTIPAANNMRISSLQASNDGAAVMITAADTYSSAVTITEDLNPSLPGLQVEVRVEVSIPEGTPTGSYTTNFGVRSQ